MLKFEIFCIESAKQKLFLFYYVRKTDHIFKFSLFLIILKIMHSTDAKQGLFIFL